jgi:hypothetical protein
MKQVPALKLFQKEIQTCFGLGKFPAPVAKQSSGASAFAG